MMTPALAVEDLRVTFINDGTRHQAVDGISFTVAPQETLGIVGESGSGKSVTALSVMGLLPQQGVEMSGTLHCGDICLSSLSAKERTAVNGRDLAMIYQEPMSALNPLLSIGTQLREAVTHHTAMPRSAADAHACALLEQVGLANDAATLRRYPFQLSGGQRQRVMIAMAFAAKPRLLIADEPTTALDVSVQAQILALMRDLRDQYQTSILLITHDLGVVAQMAQRVVVLYAGRIMETAPVDALFATPHHPYTRGLMQAIPRIDRRVERLYTIRGQVPRDLTGIVGCPFAARCNAAMPVCASVPPASRQVGHGHSVCCHLYTEKEPSL